MVMTMPKRVQRKRTNYYPVRIKAWRKSPTRPRAKCHPERPHRARGLCDSCYDKWLYANSPQYNARRKQSAISWRKKFPERKAESSERARLKRQYGLTMEQVRAMRASQNGKCAICDFALPLAVDHCHTTGKVRGMLCLPCNGSLAWVERLLRNDAWMLAARKYLEASNAS